MVYIYIYTYNWNTYNFPLSRTQVVLCPAPNEVGSPGRTLKLLREGLLLTDALLGMEMDGLGNMEIYRDIHGFREAVIYIHAI